MSKEKPNEDPRQQTDWKNTKQTDQPWKGPVEREPRNEDRIDLEKWHDTNTHWPAGRSPGARQSAVFGSPQRLASTNDVTRVSRIRRRLDQGTCPPAKRVGKYPAQAQSQRPYLLWPVSVPRAQLSV